jgi:hypothetical protein
MSYVVIHMYVCIPHISGVQLNFLMYMYMVKYHHSKLINVSFHIVTTCVHVCVRLILVSIILANVTNTMLYS